MNPLDGQTMGLFVQWVFVFKLIRKDGKMNGRMATWLAVVLLIVSPSFSDYKSDSETTLRSGMREIRRLFDERKDMVSRREDAVKKYQAQLRTPEGTLTPEGRYRVLEPFLPRAHETTEQHADRIHIHWLADEYIGTQKALDENFMAILKQYDRTLDAATKLQNREVEKLQREMITLRQKNAIHNWSWLLLLVISLPATGFLTAFFCRRKFEGCVDIEQVGKDCNQEEDI